MKESAGVSGSGGQTQGSGSGSGSGRSASDKEKTKLRERQRRSITTKIFHGLRKHGGYHLSPRADINDVLRQLAKEAGWVIEPDGTTYRPTTTTQASNCCAVCGAGKRSGTPTPTSSFVGGAECSATASPCRFPIGDPLLGVVVGPTPPYLTSGGSGVSLSSSSSQDLTSDRDVPLALYVNMYGRLAGGLHPSAAAVGPSAMAAAYQQQMYLQEVRASNQSTPVRSPQRRA